MFSDEEIKEIPESSFMRSGDEILCIREVCLSDKFDRKDLGLHLLPESSRSDLDVPRSLFRDGFFPEGLESQARFAWTEEDGNIASLVSEPGFGTTGQTTFGEQIDAALKGEMKEADTSSAVASTSRSSTKSADSQLVTSTSSGNPTLDSNKSKTQGSCKVDKEDPRSRYHFVKYVQRHGRTVRLWECGICSREFQHQYTLMRHLPTHTDERNFHCAACGKSFRQLSTLSQHRAIHSSERPYSCELCNKTFNRVSTLISHRKTHSYDKPYKCHICPKGFHQKGNLRNHLFTHTNERPYRCNICYKGFNQQSNLVCHKNKAHPEDGSAVGRRNNTIRANRLPPEPKPDKPRPQLETCEVSSSVSPFPGEAVSSSWANSFPWNLTDSEPWGLTSGVIVDAIKTYHMEVALATKQTPFALLKPDKGGSVLVKVVDTSLPGGKQMLVPATAEDLRVQGKIIVNKDDVQSQEVLQPCTSKESALQIRVPVVATVVPRIQPGGRLQLHVEEPHKAYHTAISHLGEVNVEPCSLKTMKNVSDGDSLRDTRYLDLNKNFNNKKDNTVTDPLPVTPSCPLPPPSPPLDLITMDLFEPMECMPLGPQITAVDNIDQPPPSDDSDIFIGKFEIMRESIPLSDSD